jgi:hypothetical protein
MEFGLLESNLDVAPEVLLVRDRVMSHVSDRYAEQAPGVDLAWIGERSTPEGSVGHESCQFTADDWTMSIAYDVVRADQLSHQVELRSASTGFVWRGLVDAEGKVKEVRALP